MLERYHCPMCGASLNPPAENEKFVRCVHCGETFVQDVLSSQEALLKMFDDFKQEQIAHCRSNLWDATHEEFLSSEKIRDCCLALKQYLTEDFQANFYLAATDANSYKLAEFLQQADYKSNKIHLCETIEFCLKILDNKCIVLPLANLIETAKAQNLLDTDRYTRYIQALEEQSQLIDDGTYIATASRDVFVAYSSKDLAKVTELVSYLENQGFTCFVAARNLRHGKGAVENYQREIEKAIDACECFLFVSSESSRNFSCDAIKIELPYFAKTGKNKQRIEYLIEEYGSGTSQLAKDNLEKVFKELSYCRDKDDVLARLINRAQQQEENQSRVEELQKQLEQSRREKEELEKQAAQASQNQNVFAGVFGKVKSVVDKASDEFKKGQFSLVQKLAEQGDTSSQCKLASYYQTGNGVKQSHEEAAKWYRRAADRGDAYAQWCLGQCYEKGTGVKQNLDLALNWYLKASQKNPNYVADVQRIQKTLESLDPDVLFNDAEAYFNGTGVEKDIPEAVQLYIKAGERGHLQAQAKLGYIYTFGVGVVANNDLASFWYLKAANQGDSKSQLQMATNYADGVGVDKNINEAVVWYKRAAQNGEVKAMGQLGHCYLNGIGVDVNKEEALHWFTLANDAGGDYSKEIAKLQSDLQKADATAAATIAPQNEPDNFEIHGNVLKRYRGNAREVVIPDNITAIDYGAFSGQSTLVAQTVTIPESVVQIQSEAFAFAKNIIAFNVAQNNPNFKSVDGVLYTKDGQMLVRYPALKEGDSYVVPSKVKQINVYAFANSKLQNVELPEAVTLDRCAFLDCASLQSVTLGKDIVSIPQSAFQGCVSLTSVHIPASVAHIGVAAFAFCRSLYRAEFEVTQGWQTDKLLGKKLKSDKLADYRKAAKLLLKHSEHNWQRI